MFRPKSWRHLGLRGKKGPKFKTWEPNTLKVWNLSPGHICGREIRKCHPFYTKNMFRPKSWRHLGLRGKKGPKLITWELNTLKVWNLSPGHICGREIRKCHPFHTKNMFRPKSWRHLGRRGKKGPKFKTWELNTLKVWNLSPGHICGREIRKCHPFCTKNMFRPKSWRHLGLRGKKGPKFITWELNTLKVWNLSPGHICGREIRKCHPFYTKNMFRPKSWRHLGLRGKKGPKFITWEPNTLKVWNLSPGHICGREIRKCHPFCTKNMFRPKSWRHLGLRGKKGPKFITWTKHIESLKLVTWAYLWTRNSKMSSTSHQKHVST